MNKKTDHASAKQKEEAWRKLTDEFNSNNVVYRTKKQLIYKFNNMKKNARKVTMPQCSLDTSQDLICMRYYLQCFSHTIKHYII